MKSSSNRDDRHGGCVVNPNGDLALHVQAQYPAGVVIQDSKCWEMLRVGPLCFHSFWRKCSRSLVRFTALLLPVLNVCDIGAVSHEGQQFLAWTATSAAKKLRGIQTPIFDVVACLVFNALALAAGLRNKSACACFEIMRVRCLQY